MPYKSDAQRRWAHTQAGMQALGGKEGVNEWDQASKGKDLPEKVQKMAHGGMAEHMKKEKNEERHNESEDREFMADGGVVEKPSWKDQLADYFKTNFPPDPLLGQPHHSMGSNLEGFQNLMRQKQEGLDEIDRLEKGPIAPSSGTPVAMYGGGMIGFPHREKSGPSLNTAPNTRGYAYGGMPGYADGGMPGQDDDFMKKLQEGTTGIDTPPQFNPKVGLPPALPPAIPQVIPPQPQVSAPPVQIAPNQYGAEQQMAVANDIAKRRASLGQVLPQAAGGLADAIMQGVARAGPGDFQRNIIGQQNLRDKAVQDAMEKAYGQKKEQNELDITMQGMNAPSAASQQSQAANAQLLKSLGYSDAAIAKIPANKMDEVVKQSVLRADVLSKVEGTKAGKSNAADDREERHQDLLFQQSKAALDSTRGDFAVRDSEAKRDAASTVYNRLDEIKKSGVPLTPTDLVDLLALTYKARSGAAPTEQVLNDMRQDTLKGNIGKWYTFATGKTAPATTEEIANNLKDIAKSSGVQAQKFHDQYMEAHKVLPPDLEPGRRKLLENLNRGQNFNDMIKKAEAPTSVTQYDPEKEARYQAWKAAQGK